MMTWLRVAWAKVMALFLRKRLDREFDEELAAHLELLIDEGRREGLSPTEARRQAILKLGQPELLRELNREHRGVPRLEVLAQDLRYAIRMMGKSPAFTCIVILSLALGIGANTALFSLVDGLLLRSLPVRDADRLVQIQMMPRGQVKKPWMHFSRSVFDSIRKDAQVVSEVVGFAGMDRPAISIDGTTEPPRQVEQVSENFFRGLGVTPVIGRTPESSDGPVVVISYGLWRDRFGASTGVLGRPVAIGNLTYPIIGVAPPRFLGLSIENSADLWVSSSTDEPQLMIARLQPGVTPAQAQAQIQVTLDPWIKELRGAPPMQAELLPAGKGLSQLRAQYERPLLALMVLVTLVLLITCTNVGSLLMVRNTARKRELTVRVALGASRSRLIMQYLVESAVLAALGGIFALAFARWGVSLILTMLPLPAIPGSLTFQADARTLAFVAGLSLVSSLLFGLAPAWRAAQVDLTEALKTSQGSTPTRRTRRLGRSLVACQVAFSVLLLVAAGLFVQTLRNLSSLDLGFKTDSLLQVLLNPRGSGYKQGQMSGLTRMVFERLSAIPGVHSVTNMRNALMGGGLAFCRSRIAGLVIPDPEEVWDCTDVGPGFFETMGVPLVRGRTFTAADFEADRRDLLVVNEAFAKRYFPNGDPLTNTAAIIGVVRDAKLAAVRKQNGPMAYSIVPREPDRFDVLHVRIAGNAPAVTRAIRQEILRVNPRLLIDIRPVREVIDRSIAKERMVAATSAFFSVLGLLLAAIGIFGVASYTVAQRTNELGIRMALGAGRWSVIRESLRETMQVFGIGLAAGIVASIAAVRLTTRFISELLFGITATDAANIAGAALVMVAGALIACLLPARRATRIDPLTAIRYE